MTFVPVWEEFEKSAEMLYLRDPINTRYSVKYSHSKGVFLVKITDNKKPLLRINFLLLLLKKCVFVAYQTGKIFSLGEKCLQYKTEVQQDVRKIDKFISNLIRHMASNEN